MEVAFGEALLGKIERFELHPVDKKVVRRRGERLDSAAHRQARGGGDAAGVDFGGGRFPQ